MEERYNKYPFVFPFLFVLILWAIKLFEIQNNISFSHYAVFPRDLNKLFGIFVTPFVHADFEHLTNNSLPLLVLGTVVFYFYREVAVKIFVLVWLLSGFWVWMAARPAFHIGASGVVYGLSSFIFFSGLFRKYYKMIAISLLVVFLYGSMVWGIFPMEKGVSWEGHLFGAVSGLILAYHYRKIGPQRKVYDWELEEEDDWFDNKSDEDDVTAHEFTYVYKPKSDD